METIYWRNISLLEIPIKTPICQYCGSDQISADAYAKWDYQNQEWILSSVYENGYCTSCETDISDIEMQKLNEDGEVIDE